MKRYELATSLHFRYDRECKVPITHEIERLADCGFENLDFNFLDMCINPSSDFLKENYEEWLEQCRQSATNKNAKFVQAHAPCESVYDIHSKELLLNLCKKAIKGCAILGVPWMVFHPIVNCKFRFGVQDESFAYNLKFFRELLPVAKEYSVGMAIEEIVPFYVDSPPSKIVDDLIELIDTLDSEYVGACWDFGHANLYSFISGAEHIAKQSEQLIRLGDRLKCTHVHDNNAKNAARAGYKVDDECPYKCSPTSLFDEHIQPFMGDIDWKDVVYGLDKIKYSHYFTFEAHRAANTVPEEIVNDALIHLRKVGESIIAMSEFN